MKGGINMEETNKLTKMQLTVWFFKMLTPLGVFSLFVGIIYFIISFKVDEGHYSLFGSLFIGIAYLLFRMNSQHEEVMEELEEIRGKK